MELLIGLCLLAAGVAIVWLGRPEAGTRFAAFVAKPKMGGAAALGMTTVVALGIAFTLAGIIEILG